MKVRIEGSVVEWLGSDSSWRCIKEMEEEKDSVVDARGCSGEITVISNGGGGYGEEMKVLVSCTA